MVFNQEDKVLVKVLQQNRAIERGNFSKFPNRNWSV